MDLFYKQGHMRFHRPVERAYRRGGFDQHWAGQLEEITTGTRFVIDSWFQDNGMLPHVTHNSQYQNASHLLRQGKKPHENLSLQKWQSKH